MATHSSVLAWRIPGTGEPGGLPSMGSHRVGHDCSEQQQQQLVFDSSGLISAKTLVSVSFIFFNNLGIKFPIKDENFPVVG